MKIEKQKNFLIRFIFLTVVLGLVYIGVQYVLPAVLPLALALLIAVALKNPIKKISESKKWNRTLVSIVMLIIFYAIFTLLIGVLASQFISFIRNFITTLPDLYINRIEPFLIDIGEKILVLFPQIAQDVEGLLTQIINSTTTFITNATELIVSGVGSIVTKVPSLIANSMFTIIASFFFTIYYHDITDFFFRQLPEDKAVESRLLKGNVVGTVWKYIKSYAILMSITFVELSIGLVILRVNNPLAVSAIIALIDILPVLGVGTVLIPWAIISLFTSDFIRAIGLFVLYAIITIVRQSLEPKVIGNQIGIHPVVTLAAVYIGGRLFGILGVFLLPISLAVIKQLHDDGKLNWFK